MSLFNKKAISRAIAPVTLCTDAPDAAKLALLSRWAAAIKFGEIEAQKKTAHHGNFNDCGAWSIKAFKADIPLKERDDWGNWIAETRQQIHALAAKITALEVDINTHVYALFDLTSDEITLLESSL